MKRLYHCAFALSLIAGIIVECHGQVTSDFDSLRREIKNIKIEQNRIKLNLERSHDQFSSGTLVIGIGLGISAIGAFLQIKAPNPGKIPSTLIMTGGATVLIGGIIQIDSHKWIGRASKRKE